MTLPMPKHEIRNTFYWITRGVNTVWQWNLESPCHVATEKYLSKNYTENVAWKIVSDLVFVFEELSTTAIRKIFEQADYIVYVTIKIFQNQHRHPQIPF